MTHLLTTAAVLAALVGPPAVEDKIVVEFACNYSHLLNVSYEKILPKVCAINPGIETKMRAT